MWLTFGKLFCGVAALPKGLGVEVPPKITGKAPVIAKTSGNC